MGFKLEVVVCVDDPTAHQLTSGSDMESHANTHTTHMLVTKMSVWWGRGGGRVGRKECVRGVRKGTKQKCACLKDCLVQSIQDIERCPLTCVCSGGEEGGEGRRW